MPNDSCTLSQLHPKTILQPFGLCGMLLTLVAQQASSDAIEWSEWIADLPWSKRSDSETHGFCILSGTHFTTLGFSIFGCFMPKLQPWQTKRLFALGSGWDRSLPTNRDNNRYLAEVSPCSHWNASCGGPLGQETCLDMPWSPWEKNICYDEIWGNLIGLVCWKSSGAPGAVLWINPFYVSLFGTYGTTMRATRAWIQQIELHTVSLPRCLTIYDNVVQARWWAHIVRFSTGLWDAPCKLWKLLKRYTFCGFDGYLLGIRWLPFADGSDTCQLIPYSPFRFFLFARNPWRWLEFSPSTNRKR